MKTKILDACISAPDIKQGQFYTSFFLSDNNRAISDLVMIKLTETEGWLRGRVEIDPRIKAFGSEYISKAIAIIVETGKTYFLPVWRKGLEHPWIFYDRHKNSPSLFLFDKEVYRKEANEKRADAAKLMKRVSFLEAILSK